MSAGIPLIPDPLDMHCNTRTHLGWFEPLVDRSDIVSFLHTIHDLADGYVRSVGSECNCSFDAPCEFHVNCERLLCCHFLSLTVYSYRFYASEHKPVPTESSAMWKHQHPSRNHNTKMSPKPQSPRPSRSIPYHTPNHLLVPV